MTTHSNPLNSREVCLQLRHFNQVIGQQCRNMARQNTTCPCCLTDIATGCDAGSTPYSLNSASSQREEPV